MKFKGTVAECLVQYAQPLPFEGSRDRRRFYAPLAAFVDVSEETVGKWLRKEDPLRPNGVGLIKAAFFFELLGGEVAELESLKRHSMLNYQLAEIIALGVMGVGDARQLLNYKNDHAIVGLVCRNDRVGPERESALRELVTSYHDEADERRSQVGGRIRQQLTEWFGKEFFADGQAPVGERSAEHDSTPAAPAAEQGGEGHCSNGVDAVPPEEAVETVFDDSVAIEWQEAKRSLPAGALPACDNETALHLMAGLLATLDAPLAALVRDGTPAARQRLRAILTQDGEVEGERLFRISNSLNALCGEKALQALPVSAKQSKSK